MLRVSIREFQLHAKKYLKELPIELTQYNIPVATIVPFAENGNKDFSPEEQEEIMEGLEEVSTELKPMCDRNFCKSRSEGRYKVVTNSGEEEWTGNLCTYHWNQARKEGEVSE